MVKISKLILLLVLFLTVLISLNFVSAELGIVSVSPQYVNRTINTLMNVSLNNTFVGGLNITEVTIALTGAIYYPNSNVTTSSNNSIFANITTSGVLYLNWTNRSSEGLVEVNSSAAQDFIFNISFASAGDKVLTVITNDTGATGNVSYYNFTVNFDFAGFIKNETGSLVNGTNVSVYQFVQSATGPPTEVLVEQIQVTNNNTGEFIFKSINGSATMYKLKFIHYNDSYTAVKTTSILPPFPSSMYYPGALDMSLNGSTFYLQAAATLRLNATNDSLTSIPFGYEVVDQKVGFPIESNMKTNVTTTEVVVPTGRDYTVVFLREMSQFTNYGPGICNGTFMNSTGCPTPPKSNSTLGTLVAGQTLQVTQDLSVTNIRLAGCIAIAGGQNQTSKYSYNITNIYTKLQPWTGFIPPIRGDTGGINVTADISYNLTLWSSCNTSDGNGLAWYNVSILGNTPYMLEFYAKNDSYYDDSGGGGLYLAGFQNLTTNATGLQFFNISLYRMLGSFIANQKDVNTSQMKINIQNSSGGAMTTSMHVEVQVKNPVSGTTHYIIESLTNGSFYLPILNNSNWAKVSVFPNEAPPIVKKLNLTAPENNITLITIDMSSGGGDKGLRRMNASGALVAINASTMPVEIRFLKRGTSIEITSMNATSFNPLKALVAGSVDLELKITATNVTMKFNNFDMLSAKQPPMFAVMDNLSLASSSQTWKFGNFVPKDVYDNVTIIIPYDSTVNESLIYNMSIPVLYQEDQDTAQQFETAWNISRSDTTANITDDFLDYNNSRYRSYLTSGGVLCSKTDSGEPCYMDITNNQIQMEIPHFSGLNPSISGVSPPGGATSTSDTSGGGGGFWIKTIIINEEQLAEGTTRELKIKHRIRVKVNDETHYIGVVKLTTTSATINITSAPKQAIFAIGEEKKFDVTDDDFYDLYIKLNSITNNAANITTKSIHEEKPEEEPPAQIIGECETEDEKKCEAGNVYTCQNKEFVLTEKCDYGCENGECKSSPKTTLWWVWIIIGIIIVIVAIWLGIGIKQRRGK